MPVKCCVPGCKNGMSNNYKRLAFFHFPTDEEACEEWLSILDMNDFEPRNHHRVCSAHFEKESIIASKRANFLKANAKPMKKTNRNSLPFAASPTFNYADQVVWQTAQTSYSRVTVDVGCQTDGVETVSKGVQSNPQIKSESVATQCNTYEEVPRKDSSGRHGRTSQHARERTPFRRYRMRTAVEQCTDEAKLRRIRSAQRSRKYREKRAMIQTAEQKALRLLAHAERMRRYRQTLRNRKAVGKRIPVARSTVTCNTCADFKLESEAMREKCESYKRLVAEQIHVNANTIRSLMAAKTENDNLMKMSRLQRHTDNVTRLPDNEMEKLREENLMQTERGNDSTADNDLKQYFDTNSYEEVTVKVEPQDLMSNELDDDQESKQDDETDVNNDGMNMECSLSQTNILVVQERGMLTRDDSEKTELAGRGGEDIETITCLI